MFAVGGNRLKWTYQFFSHCVQNMTVASSSNKPPKYINVYACKTLYKLCFRDNVIVIKKDLHVLKGNHSINPIKRSKILPSYQDKKNAVTILVNITTKLR